VEDSLILVSRLLIAALVAAVSLAAAAGVYKWVDRESKAHFSDQPLTSDYEAVQLKPISVVNGESVTGPRAPQVRMFTTSWCSVCKRAKAWFDYKGIAYTEYDVERSDIGRSEYRRLKGKGVPIILIGDQRMDGFSEARAEAMLKGE